MSFLNQSEIADNQFMLVRVAQCAAGQGEADPDAWANINRRTWAAAPGWDSAWASAQAAHENDPAPEPGEQGYDPGADEAVITDPMILSQVQSML
jgi:hypothetical protein